jgi:hypothetical protein
MGSQSDRSSDMMHAGAIANPILRLLICIVAVFVLTAVLYAVPLRDRGLTASLRSLPHRNCLAPDRTARLLVAQKSLEKEDTVLCYARSRKSLRLVSKPPRQRLCTMKRLFVSLKT